MYFIYLNVFICRSLVFTVTFHCNQISPSSRLRSLTQGRLNPETPSPVRVRHILRPSFFKTIIWKHFLSLMSGAFYCLDFFALRFLIYFLSFFMFLDSSVPFCLIILHLWQLLRFDVAIFTSHILNFLSSFKSFSSSSLSFFPSS